MIVNPGGKHPLVEGGGNDGINARHVRIRIRIWNNFWINVTPSNTFDFTMDAKVARLPRKMLFRRAGRVKCTDMVAFIPF